MVLGFSKWWRGQKAQHSFDPAHAAKWAPTHRHRKGGLYRELARGVLEADHSDAVIYDDATGTIWIRAAVEFDDGRFTRL